MDPISDKAVPDMADILFLYGFCEDEISIFSNIKHNYISYACYI